MRLIQLVSLGVVLAGISQASTIFSTGVDPFGAALLAPFAVDTHYTRTTVTGPKVIVSTLPNPAWLANSPRSQWVDDTGNRDLNANESYFTTFTGTGATDNLSFYLGVDNRLMDILLNGNSLGLALPFTIAGNFTALHLFQIGSSIGPGTILSGSNTLEFRLQNEVGSDGGFRVEAVPEPATFAMLGGGLVLLGILRRRKSIP